MTAVDYRTLFNQVADHIERRYGLPVVISDVLDPNTGDFNGVRINIDHDQEMDVALYVLLHHFGHTAQWNSDPELRALGQDTSPGKTDVELARIFEYERNASRIALSLLHEAGITELDQWISDWFAGDWRFLEQFYRTGERLDFHACLQPGAPLLTPLAIPDFQPQRWESRWSF